MTWRAAKIEKWLNENIPGIYIDSYDVTIFPAESSKNSITKQPKSVDDLENDDHYSAWFVDLNGGKTEYIITIACVIGKSRMKGERIVTTLLPYGPEKPRAGMVKNVTTNEVDIMWEPPKGEFTKYVLMIDPNIMYEIKPFKRRVSTISSSLNNFDTIDEYTLSDESWKRELSHHLTSCTIPGLQPGTAYIIKLITKTGDRETKKPIYDIVMTKPAPVANLCVGRITTSSVDLLWHSPEDNSHLKAFIISIISKDTKYRKDLTVMKANSSLNKFTVNLLKPETALSVSVQAVCLFDTLKTVSKQEKISCTTLPTPPTNLSLEGRFCNSLTVSWDPPFMHHSNFHKYNISLTSKDISYTSRTELSGDRDKFIFSKLPEVIGSGWLYILNTFQLLLKLELQDDSAFSSNLF